MTITPQVPLPPSPTPTKPINFFYIWTNWNIFQLGKSGLLIFQQLGHNWEQMN